MFEQSLLTHPASSRKTGAIAASFMAQSAIAGVLIVGPLLYTQALPLLPALSGPLYVPPKPLEPPPVPVHTVTTTSAETRSLGAPRVFVPTRVPSGPIRSLPTEVLLGEISLDEPTIEVAAGRVPLPSETYVPPAAPKLAPVVTTPPPAVAETKPLLIGGDVLAGKLMKRVLPTYPTIARQARISGVVRLLGVIGKDGRVRDLRILEGDPMLRQAAYDAVLQWIYAPTLLNGAPVEVEAPIEVNFALR